MQSTSERAGRRPRLLLVSADDVWADAVDRFFTPHGYTVLRTATGSSAVEEGAAARPDAVLVERELPDLAGTDVCRGLRGASWMDAATPIVVTTVHDLETDQRLELLRAGAWDVLRSPADPDELVARVQNYLAARRTVDQAREGSLVDSTTGLYNDLGLARRCEELVADAFRRHAALACLAVAPDLGGADALSEVQADSVAQDVTHALHGVRGSDVTGRHAAVEFVVLAPRTNVFGVVGLARRLTASLRPLHLHVGYDAVPNVREIPTTSAELLKAAVEALHRIPSGTAHRPIQPFRPFEHRADWV